MNPKDYLYCVYYGESLKSIHTTPETAEKVLEKHHSYHIVVVPKAKKIVYTPYPPGYNPYAFIEDISYTKDLGDVLSKIFPENFPWRKRNIEK